MVSLIWWICFTLSFLKKDVIKEANVNEKELFENLCLSPDWQEKEPTPYVRQNKDLATLLSELEEIKDYLQEVKEKQWHLATMMRFHQEGFAK